MIDLWPKNIDYTEIKAPATILKEQASLLGQKTKNLLKAEVRLYEPTKGGAFSPGERWKSCGSLRRGIFGNPAKIFNADRTKEIMKSILAQTNFEHDEGFFNSP